MDSGLIPGIAPGDASPLDAGGPALPVPTGLFPGWWWWVGEEGERSWPPGEYTWPGIIPAAMAACCCSSYEGQQCGHGNETEWLGRTCAYTNEAYVPGNTGKGLIES